MPEPAAGAADLAPPVLAPGANFSGLLVLHGRARIDGRVCGAIVGADVLRIGESGSVDARVEAGEVIVAGAFEGELRARRRVVLQATASVRAAIVSPRLAVAEGCFFEGPCRIGGLDAGGDAGDAAAAGSP